MVEGLTALGGDPLEGLAKIAPYKHPTLTRVALTTNEIDTATALQAAARAGRERAGTYAIPAPLELPRTNRNVGSRVSGPL